MSSRHDLKPTLTGTGQRAAEQHRQRLARALRDNLRKRKAQERARAGNPEALAVASDDRADGGDTD